MHATHLALAAALTATLAAPVLAIPKAKTTITSSTATPALTSTTTATTTTTGIPITALSSNASALIPLVAAAVAGCTNIALSAETSNDIVNGICRPLTLLFARGTFEGGNMGNIVGPPFQAALAARLPGGAADLAVQGVNNYAADVAGFEAGGSTTGAADLVALVNATMTVCPSTKLCVSGYSQGAQVVHLAANNFTAAQTAFVNSVVLFGDPDDGQAVGTVPPQRVQVDCHALDDICLHGDVIDQSHLDYCLDVGREADFVVAESGLGA